jgi:hypothetical protein
MVLFRLKVKNFIQLRRIQRRLRYPLFLKYGISAKFITRSSDGKKLRPKNLFSRKFAWNILLKRVVLGIYNGFRFFACKRVKNLILVPIQKLKTPPPGIVTSNNIGKEYKKTIFFRKFQREMFFGTMLSDATMGTNEKSPFYRFMFAQSHHRKLFVSHVYRMCRNAVNKSPMVPYHIQEKFRKPKQPRPKFVNYNFSTFRLPFFKKLWEQFYVEEHFQKLQSNGLWKQFYCRKFIPVDLTLLTPRALAYFMMGDGSGSMMLRGPYKGTKSYTLSTHCFTLKDQLRLCTHLLERYKIETIMRTDHGTPYIEIAPQSCLRFRRLVKPYFVDSCFYKLV